MIKNGEIQFNEFRDGKFKISESVESLYPAMWYKLNICLNQDGKLEYDRKRAKKKF